MAAGARRANGRAPASALRLAAPPRLDFAPRRPPQAEKFLCGRSCSPTPLGLPAPLLVAPSYWLSRCARACEAFGGRTERRGARGRDRRVQHHLGVRARRGDVRLRSSRPSRRRRGARRWVLPGSERPRRRWGCCCARGWGARARRGMEATGRPGSSRKKLFRAGAQPPAAA